MVFIRKRDLVDMDWDVDWDDMLVPLGVLGFAVAIPVLSVSGIAGFDAYYANSEKLNSGELPSEYNIEIGSLNADFTKFAETSVTPAGCGWKKQRIFLQGTIPKGSLESVTEDVTCTLTRNFSIYVGCLQTAEEDTRWKVENEGLICEWPTNTKPVELTL